MQALACSFSDPETEICIQPLSQARGFFLWWARNPLFVINPNRKRPEDREVAAPDRTPSQRPLVLFSGALSAVTWFYVAFIGVSCPLAWKYPRFEWLAAFAVLMAAAVGTVRALTARTKPRAVDAQRNLAASQCQGLDAAA